MLIRLAGAAPECAGSLAFSAAFSLVRGTITSSLAAADPAGAARIPRRRPAPAGTLPKPRACGQPGPCG